MKFLRRLLGWLLISLGVFVLGWWAMARFVVHTINDGTVISGIASAALHEPPVQDAITQQAQAAIDQALASNGVDLAASGQQQALNDAVAATIRSEGFIDYLVALVHDAETGVIAQLTDETLPEDPLVITLDISEPLNEAIGATPGLAGLIPPAQLEPITFEALSAESVGHVRTGYTWIARVSTWGLFVGIALIALGILVQPKKRWIFPKLLLRVGVVVLLAWFAVSRIKMDWVLDHVPGGTTGGPATALNDLFPQENIDRIQSALLKLAIVLLVLAAIAFGVVRYMYRDRKEPKTPEEEPEEEPKVKAPPPVPVSAVSGVATIGGDVIEGDATPAKVSDDVPFDQDAAGPAGIDEEPSTPR